MDLLEFLSGGPLNLKILTIDSSLYLKRLRELYPNAKLFAVTSFEEVMFQKKFSKLDVNWSSLEIIEKQKFFDIIIAESLLTYTKNSYDDLMKTSRALTERGFFLGSFKNIRFASILNELKAGRFPFRDEHLYAKDEIVKMLNDAIFKEINFFPMEQDLFEKNTAAEFENLGFDNFNNDLITKTWMFKAAVSTSSQLALKELYTEEIRKNLAKLLHRIEYDVERKKSLEKLWELVQTEHIFPDYLAGFLNEITIYKENMAKILSKSAADKGLDEFADEISLLSESGEFA